MAQSSNNQQEYEYYQQIKLLGEGSFGKAYLVKCQSDGTLCVIKKMEMKQMSEQEKQETVREAHILEALNHPNIVRFREVYKTKRNQLCIVMDYCDGGDLSKKILEFKGRFIPENQVCLALKHVHDRKIVHRDLKAQNIFLMKDNTLKVGDFGIAKVLRHTRENCKTMVGTPYYISPEIIESKPYSFRSDIWSLGVILYEMCTQKPPFDGIGLSQLALKIVRGQYNPISSFYSKELSNLISVLLNVDPLKRPLINQILKMPIIHNRIKKFLSETIRQNEFSHTVLHNLNFVNNNLNIDNIPPPQPRPQQQQSQPQQNPNPNQQQLSRQPAQNINNNNNNLIGAYQPLQGRNMLQQKPSQQNIQQPSAILGNLPQNLQQPSQNYQLFQNKPSQQQSPGINNFMNNKADMGGYKVNNNYGQNQPGVGPAQPLFMKIQVDQQQQQQKQPIQNIAGGNVLGAQNGLQKQQQLLNQQKMQFVDNTNNNDLKKQNNINNPNAQDYYNGPVDKLRREISEPVFVSKSKPLFDNIEQKKQMMQQKEKALEKKIEEIKAENKKAQQYNKIYDHLKNDDSAPQLNNNNNYNPNNYKVNNNQIPQTKRESIPSSQPSNLGQSKKNMKNMVQQQPSVEDKEKRKQKREEERKSMQEDIKMKRQLKNMESQDSKSEFFQNLKPPKDEQNDNQSKEAIEKEIKKNQSSKKLSKKDIPVEIFFPKTPYSGNSNQQQIQQAQNAYQSNNCQYNNNKLNQKNNVSDYQQSPTKQIGNKEERQNSHGSKDSSQENEDISYMPHANKEIFKQLLELNLTDEEGVDNEYNSSNSENSEQREKQNRLVQELDKSVNEIQKRFDNDIERDDEEDEADYIDSDLSSRLNNIKERDDQESSESDDGYNERKSQSDFNDEREEYEKDWEVCSSRKDSDCEDSDYFKEENVYSKQDKNDNKNKVQNRIFKNSNLDDNQNQQLIHPQQKEPKTTDSKQYKAQNSPQKHKNNSQQNQQFKENISNNINCQPSTATSSRSECQNETKLDTLRFVLEDKVGKLVLQSSLKQLKNHLNSMNSSQNKENSNLDQVYGMFNNLSKLFISMPSDLADDYGPLIILYYNMSTQQEVYA